MIMLNTQKIEMFKNEKNSFCFLPTKLFEQKKFPQNESVKYWLHPPNKEIRVVKSEK